MRKITALLAALALLLGLAAAAAAEDSSLVCLDSLADTSDIQLTHDAGTVTLREDGLTVTLRTDSVFVFRNGCRTAAMKAAPQIRDGSVFVSSDFYETYLCRNAPGAPSLFHGALFFPGEVLEALQASEPGPFARKLLEEVTLPTSMDLPGPHINMDRIFMQTKLSAYPQSLTAELQKLGYDDPASIAYSEYAVITGAQTLTEAGMASLLRSYPELADTDPDVMTVAEFTAWQKDSAQRQLEADLSETERAFMTDRQITLRDLTALRRMYPGTLTEQSDETLRAALTEIYDADLRYLRGSRNPFSDVTEQDWFFGSVQAVLELGWMQGERADAFRPGASVTRAMMAAILCRAADLPASGGTAAFSDVPEGTWYSGAVAQASERGLLKGYGGGRFGPGDPVTREQLAVIFLRLAEKTGRSTSATAGLDTFRDAGAVSGYAQAAMQWAVGAGLIRGSGEALRPQGTATRAELAAMLQRFAAL